MVLKMDERMAGRMALMKVEKKVEMMVVSSVVMMDERMAAMMDRWMAVRMVVSLVV